MGMTGAYSGLEQDTTSWTIGNSAPTKAHELSANLVWLAHLSGFEEIKDASDCKSIGRVSRSSLQSLGHPMTLDVKGVSH
jgi:hypothetical protein